MGDSTMARVTVDPTICSGKPCVTGTRIPVRNILGMFSGGYTIDRILDAHPELTLEDVKAAVEYTARVVDERRVISAQ